MGNGECFLLYEDEVRAGKLIYKSSQILTNQICEDLWTIGNVAIHLRQGYGGQDVKVLPVPVFNTNESV
jgi:hypothetical protein